VVAHGRHEASTSADTTTLSREQRERFFTNVSLLPSPVLPCPPCPRRPVSGISLSLECGKIDGSVRSCASRDQVSLLELRERSIVDRAEKRCRRGGGGRKEERRRRSALDDIWITFKREENEARRFACARIASRTNRYNRDTICTRYKDTLIR